MVFIVGAISIANFERIFNAYFDGELQKLVDELPYMIDDRDLVEARTLQISICANLDVYHSGARLMLEMRDLYKLTGDFKDMDNILASVRCSALFYSFVTNNPTNYFVVKDLGAACSIPISM